MKWSEKSWQKTSFVYDAIIKHPFIVELMRGTLPIEKFEFYLYQDAQYLNAFGKCLSYIASKFDDHNKTAAFLGFALDTVNVEKALHESYFPELKHAKNIEQSPSCLLYTSYMRAELSSKSLGESIAAVLPCFWIYNEVGKYIYKNQDKNINNPYKKWIETYSGEFFEKAVSKAIEICDEVADNYADELQQKMTGAFITASKMEWLFWDSAYNLEKWKI